jgi:hypothetical protein
MKILLVQNQKDANSYTNGDIAIRGVGKTQYSEQRHGPRKLQGLD